MRDLNKIFINGQTNVLSFGVASVAQVIKMMEFQSEDHLEKAQVIKMMEFGGEKHLYTGPL